MLRSSVFFVHRMMSSCCPIVPQSCSCAAFLCHPNVAFGAMCVCACLLFVFERLASATLCVDMYLYRVCVCSLIRCWSQRGWTQLWNTILALARTNTRKHTPGTELAGLQACRQLLAYSHLSSLQHVTIIWASAGKRQAKRMLFKCVDRYLSGWSNTLPCAPRGCLGHDCDDLHDDLTRRTRGKMFDVIDRVGDILLLCLDNTMNCGWKRCAHV